MSVSTAVRVGRLRRRPIVLMYHGFTESRRADDPENLFVEIDQFAAQLDHLLAHGWEPLTLDRFLEARTGGPVPAKSFLLTIDDGFESAATLAAPVLAARSVPFLLFVCAELLGQTAWWLPAPAATPILCADALRRLVEEAPVEIGGHGSDHVHMLELSEAELARQTAEVRSALGDTLGTTVRAFAYPYGSHDADARRAVAAAGYDVAFAVFRDHGPYAISRVDVNAADTLTTFRLKLTPGYRTWWQALEHLRPLRRALRQAASAVRAAEDPSRR